MLEFLLHLVDDIGEKAGNLFSAGTSDGLTPRSQAPLWIQILGIVLVGLLVIAGIWINFYF